MAWAANGPVSIPGKGTQAVVAVLIAVTAAAGAYLGFRASLRDVSHASGVAVDQELDTAAPARPIVDITPMQAPPPVAAATNTVAAATNAATAPAADVDATATNAISVRTANLQREQSQSAAAPADLDQQNTSPTERPQAPAKPSTDDEPAQTSAPAKNDVPF